MDHFSIDKHSGFTYGSKSVIWNNGRDTATLRDGNGTVVDMYTYP